MEKSRRETRDNAIGKLITAIAMYAVYQNNWANSKLSEALENLKAANPFDLRLNNHPLKGAYASCRSINVGGDLRAIYEINNDRIVFRLIGTHAELYGK